MHVQVLSFLISQCRTLVIGSLGMDCNTCAECDLQSMNLIYLKFILNPAGETEGHLHFPHVFYKRKTRQS